MLPTKFNWMGKKQKNKNISDVCYLPIIWLVNTLFFSLPTQYVRSLPHWRKTSPTCYPATTMDIQRGFFISHRTRNYENKLSVLCNADIGHGIMINTYSKMGRMEVTSDHRSRDTAWTRWVKEMVLGQCDVFAWLGSNFSWRNHEKFLCFWGVKQQGPQDHLKS